MKFSSAEEVLSTLVCGYYQERNITAVLSCVTDDIEWVGIEAADNASGKAALRALLEADIMTYPDALCVEMQNPTMQIISDDAVIFTVIGKQKMIPGIMSGLMIRTTICCVKTQDGWLANNIHTSALSVDDEKVSLQNELITEREKQKALLGSVPGGVAIYRVKKDGRIETDYVSDGLAKICGYDDGNDIMRVMAYDSRTLVFPEDYPVVAAACKLSIEKGVPTNVSYRVQGKDGTLIQITLNSVVMRNVKLGTDDVAVFYAVQTLVSDDVMQAKVEQDYYRRILNLTKTAYFEVDEAKNFYTSESFALYKVSDFGLDAIMGNEQSAECFHSEDFEKIREYLRNVSKNGYIGSVSARLLMRDGSYQWTEITAHMERDSAGKVKRMTGILRNVNPEWEKQKAQLEKELYDNSKISETLLSCLPGGVAVYRVKKNGNVTTDYVSENLAQICGYTADEFLEYLRDDSMKNIVSDDIPTVRKALSSALKNNTPLSVMYHLRKKDHTPLLVRLDANTIHSDNQQEDDVAVIYAVHTPISDESKKIISEQAMLKKLVDEVPVGLGIYEIINDKVDQIYMNEAFYTMLGSDREERIGYTRKNVLLSAHPEDLRLLHDTIDALRGGEDSAEITYRIKEVGEGWFWLHLSVSVVERNDEHILIYGVFSDYNQIKEAEQKNNLEQERFRTVAEEMNAAVFEWNKADNSFYCSAAYKNYAVSRVSLEDVMNNHGPEDMVHPEDIDKLHAFFIGSESIKTKVETVLRLKMIDGSYRWCRMIGLFYKNEKGEVTKKVGIIIDINDEHEENVSLQKQLNDIPGGLGKYDYHDGILELIYMNDAYFTMLGIDRDEFFQYSGVNNMKAVHPDDAQNTMRILDELAAGRSHADLYQRVANGKGGWFWMKLVIGVMERKDGHTMLMAVISNCDELVRTKEALQAKYEDQVRFAKMMASDAVVSFMVNLTKEVISMQNTENDEIMEVITNQTPQQSFESMYLFIPDGEIRDSYAKIFDSERITADFALGIDHKSIRHPYQSFDCWYESSYNAVRNPKSNDLEVYCVARDVSKEVQNADVNRRIISKSYDEVMLIDPMTGEPLVLIENNRSGVYDEQKVSGDFSLGLHNYILKHCADDHPEKIADALGLDAVKKALSMQDTYTVTYSMYNSNHEIVRRSSTYAYLNKYRTKILCSIQDITVAFEKETTQRNALQSALKETQNANKAKADFYSRMSHDMRTPMNGILGMAVLSEDETDFGKLKENIGKIKESGEYLLSLINDTLDIQRIESGRMTLEPKIVSTKDIVSNILDMVKLTAKNKGVILKYSAGNTDLNSYIRADALRLKQIFVNLLSNAVKFTPKGGTVDFEFKLLSREGNISHDVVYVRDTGIGMSKEFLAKGIFRPFSQESNAVSTVYAGSGLGLSIAKSLVELMNGHIEVESELGVGTTFAVYIDFERVDDSEVMQIEQNQKRKTDGLTIALNGKKILLAEDHPLNAEIALRLLKKVGCEAVWVKNGAEAADTFEAMSDGTFDAILMDIRMPVMDGLEAARKIRSLSKADASVVPIIAMTANAYDEDIRASLEAGMNAHLGKPVEPKNLYETLVRYLNHDEG